MSEQCETGSGKKRGRARWFVRGACLAAATAILVLARQQWWPVVVVALSPFVGLTALLATRGLQASLLVGLAVGSIALVRPRWFCRWVCPAGFCADGVSRLGRRLGRGRMRRAPIGQWVLWMTLGGALVGVPLLL